MISARLSLDAIDDAKAHGIDLLGLIRTAINRMLRVAEMEVGNYFG